MKKTILLFVLLAGFSWKGKAQQFIASYGVQHSWEVPYYVTDVVYDNFYDYDWVHATRIVRGRRVSFDILLQRGRSFVELNIGHHGRIRSTRFFNRYPYGNNPYDLCGFDTNYYNTYYTTYNGYSRITYRPGIRVHVNSYRPRTRYRKTYYYDQGYRYRNNNSHAHSQNNKRFNDNRSRNRNNVNSGKRNRQAEYKRGDNRNQNNRARYSDKDQPRRRNAGEYYTRRN